MSKRQWLFNLGVAIGNLANANNEMLASTDIVINKIRPKYNKKAKFALDLLADHAVTEFYDSYPPHVYTNRKEDLFNAYEVIADNEEWTIDMGPEFMHGGHRASNKVIYTNSFEFGWHGGAIDSKHGDHPNPGEPWWRAPVGEWTYWLSPAEQGPSPKDIIDSEFDGVIEPIEEAYGDEGVSFLRMYIGRTKKAFNDVKLYFK